MNWTLLAAFLLGVLATARATRLITADAFPPAAWLRLRWAAVTTRSGRWDSWEPLATCPFCAAPYVVAVDLTWALWSGAPWAEGMTPGLDLTWAGAWWFVNTWAAVSYLASMIVVRDEPTEED